MNLFTEANAKKIAVHVFFIVLILICATWVYSGTGKEMPWVASQKDAMNEKLMQHTMMTNEDMDMDMPMPNEGSGGAVKSRDAAVAAYLQAAQTLAEIYRFTNGDSYAGLCEKSDAQYTLEGESGGILKYIKMVGATEVFCSTSESSYLIEAQEPESGLFYCIDSTGASLEHEETREGETTCAS